jgi:hypothetical protein
LGSEDEGTTVLSTRYNGIIFKANKSNKEKTGYWKMKEYMGQYRKVCSEVSAKIMKYVIYIKTGMGINLERRRLE